MDDDAACRARRELLGRMTPGQGWAGRLSSSALATAVAAFALSQAGAGRDPEVRAAARWLESNANADGGWGDTPDSPSNLAATLLGWSALRALGAAAGAEERAAAWLSARLEGLDPERIVRAVEKTYGDDRTFAAPILSLCALAGTLGAGPGAWAHVPQLPFELAAIPRAWFRFARLNVVSYAIPALIAIGLLRHRRAGAGNAAAQALRDRLTPMLLRRLARMQPASGGYLEAIPLTGFVVLCLCAAGEGAGAVARRGAAFLRETMRPDGSWPIDTDLALWCTSLAVRALTAGQGAGAGGEWARGLAARYAGLQRRGRDPFTGAASGGWAWTARSGGVPDADDTAGALVALARLAAAGEAVAAAVAADGVRWLLELQNADGGMPTFCRGWGRLPFDRSSPDLTVHALEAFDAWYDAMPPRLRRRMDAAMEAGMAYLAAMQDGDGAWTPLWFGNQHAPGGANRVYGTARVVAGLRSITPERLPSRDELVEQGTRFLVSQQNRDGGWGGCLGAPSSIEETALAVCALPAEAAVAGRAWLAGATGEGRVFPAAPIGLYFACLWYAEDLYPLVWAIEAGARR